MQNPAVSIAKGHAPYDYKNPSFSLAGHAIPAVRVVEALDRAGFPESEWVTGVAVARRESSFVPHLIGAVNPESWDFGLWQISYKWNAHLMDGPKKIGEWDNPDDNAKMAKYLWDESRRRGYNGWRPWHTYTSGNYKVYENLAKDAVAQYKAQKKVAPDPIQTQPEQKEVSSVARMPQATWMPIPGNHTTGGNSPRLVIVHTMEGTLAGTDSWFRNPQARASTHFGVGYNGTTYQWVDTKNRAWANAGANGYSISIENEGKGSEPFTAAQIEANAAIYAWAHKTLGIPLQYASSHSGSGLGYHRQFPQWSLGGTSCPGTKRIEQIPQIMKRAAEIVGGSAPKVPAPGPGSTTPVPFNRGMDSVRGFRSQQETVNAAGYTPKLAVDGIFGDKTEAGVKWYQKKIGVTADGLWGTATEAAHLRFVGAAPAPKPQTPAPAPKPTTPAPAPSNKLKEDGILGQATVKRWQQVLNGGRF